MIKSVYNEKEYPLLEDIRCFPYYEWESLKDFYQQRLEALLMPNVKSITLQVKNFK